MDKIDSFLIENIKGWPVIASQDQEFWLSAIASSFGVLEASEAQVCLSKPDMSSALLAILFADCVQSYEDLVRKGVLRGQVPSWDELLREAAMARQRIAQFRLSRLFQWFSTTDSQTEGGQSSIKAAFNIARYLSIMPIDFIEYWHRCLSTARKHPSVTEVRAAFEQLDCVDLRIRIEAAASEARAALVKGYSRYALRIAHGYVNLGVEYADLVQEALVGLSVAAEKFDFLEHRRFATFATTWMWQHVTRCVADDGQLIRVPAHAFEKRRELQDDLAEHLKQIGFAGSLADLIVSRGMTVEECLPLLRTALPPIRIDAPKPELTGRQIHELLARNDPFFEQLEKDDLADAVMEELRALPEAYANVIALRFGLNEAGTEHTLEEIGQRYQLTRERIRQIEKKARELLTGHQRGNRLRRLESKDRERNNRTEESLLRTRRATAKSLNGISCHQGLTTYHPFKPANKGRLAQMLARAFGSRQSNVRQAITIKGQILAAFRGSSEAMHTAEVQNRLRSLYPLERHDETAIYSAMDANPILFTPLGSGVFRLTTPDPAFFDTDDNDDELQATFVAFDEPIELSAPESQAGEEYGGLAESTEKLLGEPEPVDFPIQILDRVVSSSKDFRNQRSWSLSELEWTSKEHEQLERWAEAPGFEVSSVSTQRITFHGLWFTGLDAFSLTFLLFCSEISRNYAIEGDMWSHVYDALGQELRFSFFSLPGLPCRQIREATEVVCRRLRLRHGFGREGEQSWLRTVFLQFGITRAGYKRLPLWLGDNALPPVTIQDLLNEQSHLYSSTFAALWRALQRYRWGFCTEREARAAIRGNPWICGDDPGAILAASASAQGSERLDSMAEDQNTSPQALLLPPLLRWVGATPSFEICLNRTPLSWANNSRYVMTIANQRIPVIREGSSWHFAGISDRLQVGLSEAQVTADLLEKGVSILGEQVRISLTPEPDAFCMYDLGTGRKLEASLPPHQLSRPTAFICRDDVEISCASGEFYRAFGGRWTFWAFRDGVPADLELRQHDLVVWTTAAVEEDKCRRTGSIPTVVVKSLGGWWGEEVSVSVTAPDGVEVRALRIGDQIVGLAPNGANSFRGRLQLLPGQEYSAAQVEYVDGGSLKRQRTELRIAEVNGVAIGSETGWKALDSSRDIDISYFSARRLQVKLPSHWRGEQRNIEDWVLLEGDHFCHRPRRPVSSLGNSLYGVGEPLTLSVGPYNQFSPARKLTRSLLNSGFLKWVTLDDEHWRLQLRACCDRDLGHAVWVWLSGEDSPRPVDSDRWSLTEDVCEIQPFPDAKPEAFAISYNGEWLGSRTTSPGLAAFQRILSDTKCWPSTARWLRWLRAPLLHENLRAVLKSTVAADPIITLCAWTANIPPATGLKYSETNEDAWYLVVRVALWDWRPSAPESAKVLSAMHMLTGDPDHDLRHCWQGFEPVLSSNPMLLAEIAVRGVTTVYPGASGAEIHIFLHVLQSLILGLDRGAGLQDFRVAFEECRMQAAESMSVDERFVTDEVFWTALQLVRGEVINDLNLRIALANAPIRKFIAVSLLRNTAEWLR